MNQSRTGIVPLAGGMRVPSVREVRMERARRAARRSFAAFVMAYAPNENYRFGRHTLALLRILDSLVKDVESGRSRYVIVNVPPRHGKSDIASRRLPGWIFIRNPGWEIILASYNHDLATEMSFDARACYARVAADYGGGLSSERSTIGSWRTKGGGSLFAAGIGGTITGRGANILVIDDYLKSRVEAESARIRETVRESFQHDLMTRRAPVHGVVIVANRWHTDDLVGWILRKNNPDSPDYDEDFPVFERVKFPAQSREYVTDTNPEGWLFPERFSDKWYKSHRAVLSTYGWNAQFMQDPQPRQGNILRADCVTVLTPSEFAAKVESVGGVRWHRGWDVASTMKERVSHDPDWTVGTLAGYKRGMLFVKNVVRGRWTVLQRNAMIVECARMDGPGVLVHIEAVAGYVDVYNTIRSELMGLATVRKVLPFADLVARAAVLEPTFEVGGVFIQRGEWNGAWLAEMSRFPEGHDDQVASLLTAVESEMSNRGRARISRLAP